MTLSPDIRFSKTSEATDRQVFLYCEGLFDSLAVQHLFTRRSCVDFNRFYARRVGQIRSAGRIPVAHAIREEFHAYKQYKSYELSNISILTSCENRNYFAHNAASSAQVLRATLDHYKNLWASHFRQSLDDFTEVLSESEYSLFKDAVRRRWESVQHFFSKLSGKLRGLTTALSVVNDSTDKRETIRKKTKFIFTKTDDEDAHQ